MKITDLRNGQFHVSIKCMPKFYVTSYKDALEIAFRIGGVFNGLDKN